MSESTAYFDVSWDIDKYKNNFEQEFWELCRAFMNAHKSKYPESRLVELTNAFYNIGINRLSYDAKTTRIVTALAIEISEDFLEAKEEESIDEETLPDNPLEDSKEEDSFEEHYQSGDSKISEALYLMQQDDLQELLKGFIIVCGFTKKSILKNELESLNESFLLSRFKKPTWDAENCGINKSSVRVSLSVKNHLLGQHVGKDEVTVKKQIAQALIKRISEFSPTIQANWSYYREGVMPSLPNPSSAAIFRIINDTTLEDNPRILKLIDDFAELASTFKEVAFVKVGEFQKKLIMQHVDGKWNSKLTYRTAVVTNKFADDTEIVFVYHIHSSEALLKWLSIGGGGSHNEQYSLIPPTNPKFIDSIKSITQEKDQETFTPPFISRREKAMFDPSIKMKMSEETINNKKQYTSNLIQTNEKPKYTEKAESLSLKECDAKELKSLLQGFILFYNVNEHSEIDKCRTIESLSKLFEKFNFRPLEVQNHFHNELWECQIIWDNKILAMESNKESSNASIAAALQLRSKIQSFAYTIEINDSYLCDGNVPNFILHPNPVRKDVYRLVYREDLMDSEAIEYAINEFCNESTFAELIFGPDFSWDVKNQIISYARECKLEHRFFSSNKQQPTHLALFHPVNLEQLKNYLLNNGGKTQKYNLILPTGLKNEAKKENKKFFQSEQDNINLDFDSKRNQIKKESFDIDIKKVKELPKQYRIESPEVNSENKYKRKYSVEKELRPAEGRDAKRSRQKCSPEKESSPSDHEVSWRSKKQFSAEKESKSPERKDETRSKRTFSKERDIESPGRKSKYRSRGRYSEEKEIKSSDRKDKRSENKSSKHPELILWIGVKENSTLNKNLFTILEKSFYLANDVLRVRRSHRVEKGLKFCECILKSLTKELGKGTHESSSEARALAAIDTMKMLRKTCYAIQPLDSYYQKGKALPPASSESFEILKRSKFYSINSFLPFIADGVKDHPSKEFIFGMDFNELEWKVIKGYCKAQRIDFREIQVKEEESSRESKDGESYLAVWKDYVPEELKRKLISRENKNDKYILIPPGGKMTHPGSDVDLWPETIKAEVDSIPAPEPPTISAVSDSKPDEPSSDFWLPRRYIYKYRDSLVMCKLVKQDSTEETDPISLLKASCSVLYDIEFVYTTQRACRNDYMLKVILTLKCGDEHVLMGEGISLQQEEAMQIAANQAVHTIQSKCRIIKPNPEYFAEGNVPLFIASRKVIKTATYEIVSMENMMKIPLSKGLIKKIFDMFQKSEVEDLFFLVTDFNHDERTLVIQMAEQFQLGWRLFGTRAPNTKADDVVSSQHVCVYRKKSPLEVLKQVIAKGGATDKYLMYKNGQRITTNPEEDPNRGESKPDFKMISHTKDDHTCLNDCPKYYKSTCPKGNQCLLRHEPNAKSSLIVCALWRKGKCYDKKCIKRHMEVNSLLDSSSWHDDQGEEDDSEDVPKTPVKSSGNSIASMKLEENSKPKLQSTTVNIATFDTVVPNKSPSITTLTSVSHPPVFLSKPAPYMNPPPRQVAPSTQYTSGQVPGTQSQPVSFTPSRQVSNVLPPRHDLYPRTFQSSAANSFSPAQPEPNNSNRVFDMQHGSKQTEPPKNDLPKSIEAHFPVSKDQIYSNPPTNNSNPFSPQNPSSLFKQFLNSKDSPVPNSLTKSSTVSFHQPFVYQMPNSTVTETDNNPCPFESKLGGCIDKHCKYLHNNIVDVIVNRYLL